MEQGQGRAARRRRLLQSDIGPGTSLALVGAYVLAGELATTNDVHPALARYQRVMRPFTDAAPRFSVSLVRLASPKTCNGIRVLHAGVGLAASLSALPSPPSAVEAWSTSVSAACPFPTTRSLAIKAN